MRAALMAAPSQNLWSLDHMNGTQQDTFTQMGGFDLQRRSRVKPLQRRWQELKDRERRAHQHNRQLLQQFAEAQDLLRELQARNAEMKIIRMEYERYLKENGPRWQQRLKEQTQTAQKKRRETHSGPYPQAAGEGSQPSSLQGFSKTRSEDNYVSSLRPLPVWLMNNHSHSADDESPLLPSPLQPGLLHYRQSASNQNTPWISDPHWSRTSASLRFPMEQQFPDLRVSQVVHAEEEEEEEEEQFSRAGSSGRGGSRHLSQELDVQPVRLSSGHSSESDRDSIQASRERDGQRTRQPSSDGGRRGSQKSPPSPPIMTSAGLEQDSKGDVPSGEVHISGRRRRSECSADEESEKMETKQSRSKGGHSDPSRNHRIRSTSSGEEEEREEVGHQSSGEEPESVGGESGSVNEEESEKNSLMISDGTTEAGGHENSSSEGPDQDKEVIDEDREEKDEGGGHGIPEVNRDEDGNTDGVSSGHEVESGSEDEGKPNELKGEDDENGNQSSASSEDEEETSDEEEQLQEDEAEHSEDSIVVVAQERSKVLQVIPEEKSEAEPPDEDSSDEDIETLLAPRQPKKAETEPKSEDKPKDVSNTVQMFRVQTDGLTDDEEFDDFYD